MVIWINSPGGDCIAASQIYAMLMDYPGNVTVKIDGIAASAASVIAMAGTKVLMAPTALMMIHNPATGAFGDHTDMQKAIEMLDEVIRGNHEDLYEELATVDQGQPFSHHISNGTYDTALQLTGMDKWMALIHQYDFAEAAQDTPYYKRIIPAMQNYYETAHYIFVHGWIPCLRERTTYCSIGNWRKADDNMWSTARWFNGMDANQFVYEDGKTIVCGHWHASYGHTVYEKKGSEFGPDANFQPYYGNGIIALDACTVVSGFVNCIIIDD